MERKIFLIRHAKSSWANAFEKDFDRSLNDRGFHDAPLMGKVLKEQGIFPDAIFASAAKRTTQTATLIAEGLHFESKNIQFTQQLYHASDVTIADIIACLNDEWKSVFIVTHNPGITDFVNQLSNKFLIANMPTCGIVGASFHAEHWYDFGNQPKDVFLFEFPKKYYDSK
jgi:phosphohistidine phosphatase